MALGKQIQLHRKAKGWTLEQLSVASEVDVGTISALENRDSERSKYAPALARALGVQLEVLLGAEKSVAKVEERRAAYGAHWPFTSVTVAEWNRLTDEEKAEVQGFVKALVSRHKRRAA